jgi:hypothetical protein
MRTNNHGATALMLFITGLILIISATTRSANATCLDVDLNAATTTVSIGANGSDYNEVGIDDPNCTPQYIDANTGDTLHNAAQVRQLIAAILAAKAMGKHIDIRTGNVLYPNIITGITIH